MDDRLKRATELEAEAEKLREDYKSNPPETVRTPYLIEDKPGEYRVGCQDEPQTGEYPYSGPVASVYGNKDWVHVCTDEYEGNAMLNRETLPLLIEALQKLEAHLKANNI